jgi:transposase
MNENNPKQRKKNQKYSPQFKDQAIERAEKVGVVQAAKDLGLAEPILYSWRAKRKQGGTSLEHQKLQQAEMAKLKRENERLQEENAFLKKVATYFTKESK